MLQVCVYRQSGLQSVPLSISNCNLIKVFHFTAIISYYFYLSSRPVNCNSDLILVQSAKDNGTKFVVLLLRDDKIYCCF